MACSAKEQFTLYPHHSLSTIHHHYPAPPTSVLSGARDLKAYLIEDFFILNEENKSDCNELSVEVFQLLKTYNFKIFNPNWSYEYAFLKLIRPIYNIATWLKTTF